MYRWSTPPRRVTRLAGPGRLLRVVGFLHVKAAELGNPPNRGKQITTLKPAKTHGRKTWLATTSVPSYFDDFTSKPAKTLMKLTVLATI